MQHSTGQYDDLARVPRARPREGCRRRTTASRHRRHSPPRCSCRVAPPIRDARLVDLNLADFMCNSVARQERVCRAQRPAAKIDAIATSASGRDRTSAFEPAEMPANCGLFLRDRETSVRIGLRGGGCTPDRTGLQLKFPANREINREFCKIRPSAAVSVSDQRADSMASSQIPYATEQGISKAISGNFSQITGNRIENFHI